MGPSMCQAKILNRNPEFFYSTVKENQLDTESVKQKVQLLISLSGCSSGSSYNVRLDNGLGQTEAAKANQSELKFNKFIVMEYYFEKEQKIGFNITKDSQLTKTEIFLGRVMGSRGMVYSTVISTGEKLIIQGKSMENSPYTSVFEVTLNGSLNSKPLCFFVKNLGTQSNPANTMIYRSEIKEAPNSLAFNPVVIPAQYLCNGDTENTLVGIEIIENSSEKIGEQFGTVNQLIAKPMTISLKASTGVRSATIRTKLRKEYNFLDFLRGGMQIGLTIAIDFTASNRDPKEPQSLHNITNNQMNFYEQAIKSCGDIIAYYDYDQLFPVYGYGAVPQGYTDVSHCFPLNGTADPNIHTINGVLSCYRAIVPMLRFYGPTYFAPIINALNTQVKEDLSQGKQMNYNIMMILTDGQINDMQETISAVVEASFLPISIIIIGIGFGDFGNMDVLDADDAPLYDPKTGRKSGRDLVQFVPFNKYQNDGKRLSEEVLEEIPRQVCEYYQMNQIIPGDPIINMA